MRIAIIADPHLNKSVYKGVMDKETSDLPFRTVDFMNAYEDCINKVLDIKPDLVVHVGDTFDTFDPSNSVRTFLNNQIMKLSEAGLKTVFITGNHDVCRKHHPLEPISSLKIKNIKILDEPLMTIVKDKILIFFPYSLKVEKGEINIKDQFNSFIKECKDKISKDLSYQNKEIIFFGHFPVKGGSMNRYYSSEEEDGKIQISKKTIFNSNNKDISLSDLDTIGASYVFLGDYHRHQILETKKCKAMYVGSLERTDISEIDEKKGFIIYDSEANEEGQLGKCKFIENNNCRPMIVLTGTIENMEKQLESINNIKEAIVKIDFKGDSTQLTSFSEKIDNLKKKLKSSVNPIHVIHTQNVIDEEEEKKANEIENEIINNGHLEINDVLAVVREMIREKTSEKDEILILEKMADEIYKDFKEGK